MRDPIRHFIAEFVGTFALVYVGGAAIMMAAGAQTGSGLVGVALAHGLVIAVFATGLMRISAHFNPAVTIGFLAARRINPIMAGIFIAAQIIGAVLAAYLLKATMPEDVFTLTRAGGQSISLDITGTQAFIIEAVATFLLTFVIFGTAVDSKAPRIGGLAIGFVISANILAFGPLTGASMNPARSFGPAVASGIFEAQLIYWTAPVLGAVIAALLYDTLFIRREPEPVDHGAVRPVA